MEDAQDLRSAPARDVAVVCLVYLLAIAGGLAAALTAPVGPALALGAGTLCATVLVWIASVVLGNASTYDAYWSVAPAVMATGLLIAALSGAGVPDAARAACALLVLYAWALRLTLNWLRGWGGLEHEDWRYVRIRDRTGPAWQLVNLTGIQLMPSLLTWLGTLPLVAVLLPPAGTGAPFGLLDLAALALGLTAVTLQWRADEQLVEFRRRRRDATELLDSGLWSRCRHPNYLGEMLLWWSLVGFALAADPRNWTLAGGAVAITLLFLTVSIRLIETRMLERKPAYAEYRARVPMLLPLGGSPQKSSRKAPQSSSGSSPS